MERMYREYKDIAEFRMIYINEAHAADSSWSVPYAREKGITEHDDLEERCEAAGKLLDGENLTLPCAVDGMDNAVNTAYSAWPDRVYIVRTDGRLALAAKPGPAGFKPAIDETWKWLEALRAAGAEPPLPAAAADPGEERPIGETESKPGEPPHLGDDKKKDKDG